MLSASSFAVNEADLEFILKQITIAESHASGTPLVQVIMNAYGVSAANAAQLPAGLRTVDGTYNNLLSEATKDFGAADTLFPRLTDPVFRNEGDEPGGFAGVTNTDYGLAGNVVDSDPRIISNLIVDMSISNPAAIDAFLNNPLSVAAFEEEHGFTPTEAWLTTPANADAANEALQTIPNQSPDIGLSPGFNSWMTFFGQFFDHGLDLVTKGNNGTVYVPLQPDDPLILVGPDGVAGTGDEVTNPALQFMALTRATPTVVDGVAQYENTTTSWIDQNQTYTSHPSHQVFLREYAFDANNHAVSTGRLLDGQAANGSLDGAIGNWAEVKAQALTMLGIALNDFDVHNVPMLRTDQYGRFIPGPNGYAQILQTDLTWQEGNPNGSVTTAGSIGTNHAFLDDIAHHAAPRTWDHDNNPATPKVNQTPDALAGVADDGLPGTYDDEMLASHFVTGDGRGNENIALTAVHSIFHSEHNRLVDANKATIADAALTDPAFVKSWLLNGATADMSDQGTWVWNGERLFQAARFATEMQYQHLVFEEFARRIQPMIDPFVFNNSPDIEPSIVAEFAHVVYRFGHSMLTGTVDRLDNNLDLLNGDLDQQTLLAVFLNPQAYLGSGADLEEVNANLVRGLSSDVANEIDELIVNNVRTNLLGLPLDLAVLNLARARDTGIPSLNEVRAQLYDGTGAADLAPYTSWANFAMHIKNPLSIINFIAAYGTHDTITSAATLAGKRAAAEAIVFNTVGAPADRLAFLNGTDAYAGGAAAGAVGTHGGLNLVDLWIGGLAEAKNEFGGMLGTTFNYVFEKQMEDLQFGDRLYYLSRTQGLNFLNQLEPNTFSDLVMRNTNLGDPYATHLNGQLFVTPDHILELDSGIAQADYNGAAAGLDPLYAPGEPHPLTSPLKVTRTPGPTVAGHTVGGTLQFIGGEHVVLGGTEGNDRLLGDRGIDTLWGDGGDDYLNGGTESDDVFGGQGDDVIEDPFGDDVLRGNQGNDIITSARGADLMFGDQGSDYVIVGQDASEVFGGLDNDFVLGGAGQDFLLGNEGDDWMEGGGGFDTLAGDNSELFFNSQIIGHDVLFGQGDETDYDAESGDDIMGSGPSVFRYEGMFGFDWGIAKGDISGVQFDLSIPFFTSVANDVLRDRFDNVEALSGWKYGDALDGDNRGHVVAVAPAPLVAPATPDTLFFNLGVNGEVIVDNLLHPEGVDRIAGFNAWFGNARQTLLGSNTADFRDGNILMGGGGNDFLQGRGGFDLLDGDAWLNVRMKIVVGGVTYSAESLNTDTSVSGVYAGRVFNTDANGNPIFTSPAFGGRSLNSLMLDRTINPGQLSIIREIKYDDTNLTGPGKSIDTAIFQGNRLEYEIEGFNALGHAQDINLDGFIYVRDLDNGVTRRNALGNPAFDDTDLLKNIERIQFADQIIWVTPLTATINQAVAQADPTNASTINFTVVFSESVADFATGDVALSGTAGATTAVVTGSGTTYNVAVSGMTGSGTVIASLAAGVAQTGAGNLNTASTSTDNTVSYTVPPVLDLQAFTTGNFLDNFDTASFSNSNGTAAWTTNWTETGDFGGVTAGQIQIDAGAGAGTNQLRFLGGNVANFNGASIQRVADLTGATSATLSFNYIENGVDGGETVLVQFAADGTNFTTLQTINTASNTGASNLALTGPFGSSSTLRFVVSTINSALEDVRIDSVNISYAMPTNDGSNNFAATYTEDGAAVAIASGPGITTSGSPNLQSAKVLLTNAQAGDALSISGALPAGIASSLDLSVPGVITLNLSGSATRAAYQTALAQIRFANSSQSPDTTPRTIQVTVNEGAVTSNVATATVTVISVDDPAILGADRLLLNAQNTNFVVPEWAFLANDVDPDTVLDITAVSVPVGLGTLSLALNPGAITLSDTGTANGSFSYTAGGATANVAVVLDTGTMNGNATNEILVDGAGVNNTINGNGGNDLILARDGNDTVVGGTGNDRLFGEAGNDIFTYAVGDGADAVDGGTQTTADALNITGAGANDTLNVIYNGTALTSVEGGTLVDVEAVTANLGAGTDTLSYTGTTVPVTVNLGTGAASGFTTIASIENVAGGSGADTLTGSAAANVLNGNDGGDLLTGGDGNDTINTGAADDNIPDVVRWTAVAEFGDGDTVNNFDATGTAGQIDRVEFVSPALLALFDDGTALPDGIVSWVTDDNLNNNNVAVNLNGTVEALFLDGANTEGVTTASLTSATAVAAEFNAEFALTAADGEATLLVINDTTGNSAALWRWVQAGGGEMAAGELTLIGIINANATVTTDSVGFDLGAPLLAASIGVPSGTAGARLNPTDLPTVVQAAIADWASAGLSADLLNRMRSVQFVVTDLPGSSLGMAVGNTIYLDADAAGYGWFVDRTPSLSEEFRGAASGGELRAVDPRAVNRMDLLTVVAHELGHIAGLDDLAVQPGSLMSSTLSAGVRHTAWSAAVDTFFGDSGRQ